MDSALDAERQAVRDTLHAFAVREVLMGGGTWDVSKLTMTFALEG